MHVKQRYGQRRREQLDHGHGRGIGGQQGLSIDGRLARVRRGDEQSDDQQGQQACCQPQLVPGWRRCQQREHAADRFERSHGTARIATHARQEAAPVLLLVNTTEARSDQQWPHYVPDRLSARGVFTDDLFPGYLPTRVPHQLSGGASTASHCAIRVQACLNPKAKPVDEQHNHLFGMRLAIVSRCDRQVSDRA